MQDFGEFRRLALKIVSIGRLTARLLERNTRRKVVQGVVSAVGAADRLNQRHIADLIQQYYPKATVRGEEDASVAPVPRSGRWWCVDPLDGTSDFQNWGNMFSIQVAELEGSRLISAISVYPARNFAFMAPEQGGVFACEFNTLIRPWVPYVRPLTLGRDALVWDDSGRHSPQAYRPMVPAIARAFATTSKWMPSGFAGIMVAMNNCYGGVSFTPWPHDLAAVTVIIRRLGGVVESLEDASEPEWTRWAPIPSLIAASPAIARQMRSAIFNSGY